MTTRAEAEAIVVGARSAVEVFGTGSPTSVYRRLARLLHPDLGPGCEEAFGRLVSLWEAYNRGQLVGGYRIGPPLHAGGTAMLYPATSARAGGTYGTGDMYDAVLKVARDPADNHLLTAEAAALRTIATHGDPRFLPYVPRLVTHFRHRTGGTTRQANVISRAPGGFVPLTRVTPGLDPRDAAWIWRRLLVAAGLAHRAGTTHGAIVPRHVLIHPIDHGLVLVDWCRAGATDQADDIRLLTRCVAGLIGDHPRPMAAFIHGCLRRPPSDAWALLAELDDLLGALYGPRVYRPLHL
ncbi:molecular chaperone DnaJ [Nonomuraea sp. NN258]|nr:molecular chaperone DnaJ [Nonomuraea antri]